jgi:hypothetical protein
VRSKGYERVELGVCFVFGGVRGKGGVDETVAFTWR